uniref:NAD-specific glutamate dehydrogenase n=1 Tax=Parastrongyloides trichosuri TaxID=131310 RepID=A0A0N4ZL50_PARTI
MRPTPFRAVASVRRRRRSSGPEDPAADGPAAVAGPLPAARAASAGQCGCGGLLFRPQRGRPGADAGVRPERDRAPGHPQRRRRRGRRRLNRADGGQDPVQRARRPAGGPAPDAEAGARAVSGGCLLLEGLPLLQMGAQQPDGRYRQRRRRGGDGAGRRPQRPGRRRIHSARTRRPARADHEDLRRGLGVGPQLDLGQRLVGEGGAHHEGRVSRGVAQVHEAAFRQQYDLLAVWKLDVVDLILDLVPLEVLQARDLNLRVEVADVADDGVVAHGAHVLDADDVLVARGGNEDVGLVGDVFERLDLIAFHRRLQGADRVDLGDDHAGAAVAQAGRRALAHVAVATDHGDLARQHDVGAATNGVDKRFTAAVQVVELGLGDAVVDVDGGERQFALFRHLIQAVNARGRLFRHAADGVADGRVEARLFLQIALHDREEGFLFLVLRVVEDGGVLLGLRPQHAQQGGVAPVVEDQVRVAAIGPFKDLVGVFPILDQILALEGEDRRARRGDGGGGVVLGREDVARGPAHFGAQGFQRLDQHRRLDGHVQGAGDAGALQRLGRAVFVAQRHQARHLGFGDGDFLVAEVGQGDVADDVVGHAEMSFGHCRGRTEPASHAGHGSGHLHLPRRPAGRARPRPGRTRRRRSATGRSGACAWRRPAQPGRQRPVGDAAERLPRGIPLAAERLPCRDPRPAHRRARRGRQRRKPERRLQPVGRRLRGPGQPHRASGRQSGAHRQRSRRHRPRSGLHRRRGPPDRRGPGRRPRRCRTHDPGGRRRGFRHPRHSGILCRDRSLHQPDRRDRLPDQSAGAQRRGRGRPRGRRRARLRRRGPGSARPGPALPAGQRPGAGRRHAAGRARAEGRRDRPDRVRPHRRRRPSGLPPVDGAPVGRSRGHDAGDAGAVLPRRGQLDLLRRQAADHRQPGQGQRRQAVRPAGPEAHAAEDRGAGLGLAAPSSSTILGREGGGPYLLIQGRAAPLLMRAACSRWKRPPRGGFGRASIAAFLSRSAR